MSSSSSSSPSAISSSQLPSLIIIILIHVYCISEAFPQTFNIEFLWLAQFETSTEETPYALLAFFFPHNAPWQFIKQLESGLEVCKYDARQLRVLV
uniref:Uncharacterized protein n=1 Tax=Lactuca sativa TaxID=4236 RepID=A0A9R1URI5_LACSA|nr:hypothetical protein LSAT_V11C800438900 [Lactuca sativa]